MIMMKKVFLFGVLSALPLLMSAQDDDMYFVPTKENVAKEAKTYGLPKNTYYSGSDRTVDDYNRRAWSSAVPIDSAGNDIIDFSAVRGAYPDSLYQEQTDNDYRYTRQMSRFDDYSPSSAYWEGYQAGRWSSPWYYSRWYGWYDPWYYGDPWYYSSWYGPSWYWGGWYGGYYAGWYDYYRPWHHGGWYGPGYWGGGVIRTSRGDGRFHVNRNVSSGSRTYSNGGRAVYGNGSFGNGSTMRNGSFGSSRNSTTRSTNNYPSSSSNSSFGSGSSRSSGSFGGGSHGGSRGGGSFSRGR